VLTLPNLSPERLQRLHQELAIAHFNRGYYCFHAGMMRESRRNLRLSLRYDRRSFRSLPYLGASYLPSSLLTWLKATKKRLQQA